MSDKIKYNIAPQSKAPLVSFLVSLVSVVLLCAVYWPVFVQYFTGGIYDGPEVGALVVVFYGCLIAGLLLYSISTGLFAKKSLVPAAIFSLVPSLFYILDISGLRNVILFFDPNRTFSYYITNADYFGAAWPFIIVMVLLTILSVISYFMLALNRHRGFAMISIALNALAWLSFSVYYIAAFAAPEFAANTSIGRDFAYTVMTNIAAVLYFVSQFIAAVALKNTESAAYTAETPLSVSAGSGDIDLLTAVPPAPLPAPEKPVHTEPVVDQAPDVQTDNETAIDVVIDTGAQPEGLDASAMPEQTAEPDVIAESGGPEPIADSVAAGEDLSAADIDALAAIAPDTIAADKQPEPKAEKPKPKKKPAAKSKKSAPKADGKTEKKKPETETAEASK